MDVSALKAKIKTNQLPKYLIFSGPEWKVQQIYIEQIAKVTGKKICRIESIKDIFEHLNNRSIVQMSYIYVVRDDKELMQNEELQERIESVLKNNMLILLLTNIDKRTRFYKAFNASIIEFERLSDSTLKKYTLKEIKLSESDLERLINICEHDYGRILLEIDKIKRYRDFYNEGSSNEVEPDQVLEWLLKDGTIYEPPYDAIFDLVDAILDRKVNLAFDLLQQAYEVGEATMVMLSVLYTNAKAVLQVQTYKGDKITEGTGLTGFQIKNAKSHVGKYSEKDLIYILQLIQKVESGIKTGTIEDEFAMQFLLTHIL